MTDHVNPRRACQVERATLELARTCVRNELNRCELQISAKQKASLGADESLKYLPALEMEANGLNTALGVIDALLADHTGISIGSDAAYHETHEPRHCPSCSYSLPESVDAQRVALYRDLRLREFHHINTVLLAILEHGNEASRGIANDALSWLRLRLSAISTQVTADRPADKAPSADRAVEIGEGVTA